LIFDVSFVIRKLNSTELSTAAELLARGMRDNPIHIQAFGSNAEHRRYALARLFQPVLLRAVNRGSVFGAFLDERLVGVYAEVKPDQCQLTLTEKIKIFPAICFENPLATSKRVLTWVGEWSQRDLTKPHWHLGPVAVDAHLQRQGIGKSMLAAFCSDMDARKAIAYLETDKIANVRFYEQFGFTVLAEADVLGVRNWFMSRDASL
jgi:hypothetical protein